ncbi:mitochondrial pyruvate carrier 4 isoform X1 [Raphanus sativus]|uniref:Mitochondrial pyruvate carrier n=1 Tax=Raphanus sativus TaxID=3726 RepID=A0A9W3CTM6_RAPSA|nr:mitochondrial pyruvate carrier 4 isoform X1 [Raphanus sativus]XP_056865970.1 mitochondrial pyruvate carrier 4 isoform X1 [Raphanus sativus]
MATSRLQALWNHPAGPKTIHFWAPTFKWGISIANIADFAKPTDKISYPQQIGNCIPLSFPLFVFVIPLNDLTLILSLLAVTCTGVIWSRYSMVITPKNWNLFSVNVAMAGTGMYQLARKIKNDFASDVEPVVAKE